MLTVQLLPLDDEREVEEKHVMTVKLHSLTGLLTLGEAQFDYQDCVPDGGGLYIGDHYLLKSEFDVLGKEVYLYKLFNANYDWKVVDVDNEDNVAYFDGDLSGLIKDVTKIYWQNLTWFEEGVLWA